MKEKQKTSILVSAKKNLIYKPNFPLRNVGKQMRTIYIQIKKKKRATKPKPSKASTQKCKTPTKLTETAYENSELHNNSNTDIECDDENKKKGNL